MTTTALLVHGYSGDTAGLEPVATVLRRQGLTVECLRLPGHGGDVPPAFDGERLLAAVTQALTTARRRARRLLVLGHSTGGSLLLEALRHSGVRPDLLVLAAVPHRLDGAALERWQTHRSGRPAISLASVAGLVRLIQGAARPDEGVPCPVLLLHGTADALVPVADAATWQAQFGVGRARRVLAPAAGHDLFTGPGSVVALEVLARAACDLHRSEEGAALEAMLREVEPEVATFFDHSPGSRRHLAASPSGCRLLGETAPQRAEVATEPVFLNLEVTTRCNLACGHCARSWHPRPPADLDMETFERLLDALPHAYRLTLVGLGEPLLHPQLAEMVRRAKARHRRVTLATNGMALTAERSAELLAAGLDGLALSLDTVDPAVAARRRPGTDLPRVLAQLAEFSRQARQVERPVATAVFTALAAESVAGLEPLLTAARQSGAAVAMVSDLNYPANREASLRHGDRGDDRQRVRAALRRSFAAGLPVLSAQALEEFGLARRYAMALLAPESLWHRPPRATHCVSPWQTLALDVAGMAWVCDCQPRTVAGAVLDAPLDQIWNGAALRRQRQQMLTDEVPEDCRTCPRL